MQKDSFIPTNQILALAVLATMFITCILIIRFPPFAPRHIPSDASHATSAPSYAESETSGDTDKANSLAT